MTPAGPPLTLVARPINARILAGFLAEPREIPAPGVETPAWISEAARDLHGWKVGDAVTLPIGGRRPPLRRAGGGGGHPPPPGAPPRPPPHHPPLTPRHRAREAPHPPPP